MIGFRDKDTYKDDLSIADAVELLTNRQLMSTPKKGKDFYPFDFKYEE